LNIAASGGGTVVSPTAANPRRIVDAVRFPPTHRSDPSRFFARIERDRSKPASDPTAYTQSLLLTSVF
jgi:hypothetical protein